MRKLITLSLLALTTGSQAQVVSNASLQTANPKTNRTISFNLNDEGTPTPINWGLDLQWINESNLQRGINFAGKEVVDIVRCGFMPNANVSGGKLSEAQMNSLTTRANLVKKHCKSDVVINIGSDPSEGNGVDWWYNDGGVSTEERGKRWAKCIDLHRKEYQSQGLTVVSVSPFNEPDFGWNQGLEGSRMEDFRSTAMALRQNYNGVYGRDAIRICGGNTLNNDNAGWWWWSMRDYLDEGNTHQLAGGFDSYAAFFKDVRDFGHRAVADELHNVMEAIVGVEYGMQQGIWWGTALRTRGQFMKATHPGDGGSRLAYSENRGAWTAAAVYRLPDGKVNGFVGTSERQCQPDSYRFLSLDRDVYYNGYGPTREFVVEVPGGYGYQSGQTNAETVIEITSGEDIQPVIDGEYKIVNVNSGQILAMGSSASNWQQISQRTNTKALTAQWKITPVANTIGEDFAYFHIRHMNNLDLYWDIKNWDIAPKAKVGTFPGGGGGHIEQWYFEYAGNNNFYIRSRYSNLVVEIANSSKATGATIQMAEFTGAANQQWRLIPTDVSPQFTTPEAPLNLTATPQPASIRLDWDASTSGNIRDYIILRADEGSDEFNTIGRYINGTTFVDNTAVEGHTYTYCVKAEDTALNRSERSNSVTAAPTKERALICHLEFDRSLNDLTENGNHCVMYNDPAYSTTNKSGETALSLRNGNSFLQLPSTIASRNQMTISFWLKRYGASNTQWERVFDFGNSTNQYLFFTPNAGDNTIRFEMKNNGPVETLTYKKQLTSSTWSHFTISLDADKGTATMYIDGQAVATKDNFTVRPSDFAPVCNYIARSQFDADPLLKCYLDDFRIYNYAMNDEEVADLFTEITPVETITASPSEDGSLYDIQGRRVSHPANGVYIKNGKKIIIK